MPDRSASPAAESPRALFEDSLDQIDRITRAVARRFCLRPDETEDLESSVHLRFIEDDYAVLRKFSGRSSLPTYLTAVIQNLARDHRIEKWGRWRPSAAADRLGLIAVQLETLLTRDGFSLDEAVESLRANHGVRMSRLELIDLAAKLPPREKRRVEGEETLLAVTAAEERADRGIEEDARRSLLARAQEAVSEALAELEVTDRLLLEMHFESGLTISVIARTLGLAQRELYTRRDRCLRHLRRRLEDRELDPTETLRAVGWPEADFKIDYRILEAGVDEMEPSNPLEPEAEDDP